MTLVVIDGVRYVPQQVQEGRHPLAVTLDKRTEELNASIERANGLARALTRVAVAAGFPVGTPVDSLVQAIHGLRGMAGDEPDLFLQGKSDVSPEQVDRFVEEWRKATAGATGFVIPIVDVSNGPELELTVHQVYELPPGTNRLVRTDGTGCVSMPTGRDGVELDSCVLLVPNTVEISAAGEVLSKTQPDPCGILDHVIPWAWLGGPDEPECGLWYWSTEVPVWWSENDNGPWEPPSGGRVCRGLIVRWDGVLQPDGVARVHRLADGRDVDGSVDGPGLDHLARLLGATVVRFGRAF